VLRRVIATTFVRSEAGLRTTQLEFGRDGPPFDPRAPAMTDDVGTPSAASTHARNALPVTVLVCSRDRHDQLAEALPAIRSELGPGDRLVVVDSASRGPGTADIAAALGLECLRLDMPGLARARNAGVHVVNTDIVAFTDDDCRPATGWLAALRAPFLDPSVGFVTGAVAADTDGPGNSVLTEVERRRFVGPREVAGIGHGANMAFRRDALEQVGPFDQCLGAGAKLRSGEDADMFYRCLEAGWHGVYTPAAVVTHDQWRSLRETIRLRYGYGVGNGAFRAKIFKRAPRRGAVLLLRPFKSSIEYAWQGIRARDGMIVLRATLGIAGTTVGAMRGFTSRADGAVFQDSE
jgi:GT2 family glycosyltransferase